jgi:hypothetical protein
VNIGFGWGYTWGGVENDESTDALITDDRLYLLTNYDSVSINAPGGSNLTAPGSNVSRISRDGSWIGLFPVSQDPQAHESSVSLAVASNGLICVAGDRGLDAFLRAFNQDGSLVKERIDEGYSYGGSGGGSSNSYVPIVAAADESSIFLAEKHGWSWWREIPCGNKPMFEGGCGIDLEVYQCDNDFNKLHSLCYGDAGYLSDMVLGDDGTFYMIGSGSYYEGTVLDYGTDLDHLAERVILDRYEGVSTKMALENDGTIFITGHSTYSFDSKNSAGKNDCFLTKINPDKSIAWIVTWGGPDDDFGLDVATDRNGNAYVIGTFRGAADFDTSDAVYEVTAEGIQDAFVLKVDPDGVSKWVRTFGGSPDDEVTPAGIVTDSIGCLYLYGSFTGSIDIDPTHGEDVRLSVGKKDLFLIKMLPGGNW